MKIFLFQIIISTFVLAQNIDLNSPQNIKLFADYLFCEQDYLRAIDEYEKYLKYLDNDTIKFKIALAYSNMDDNANALNSFNRLSKTSVFYELSQIEKLKSLFEQKYFAQLNYRAREIIHSKSNYVNTAEKILILSYLLNDQILPSENILLDPFNAHEKIAVQDLYLRKTNPDYKSELLAGIYSGLVPGLGKIYTENYGDGITAFVLTGLLSYLAFTNFENDHTTRAWIFTALGAGFYAGNIYGSVASAQIFNSKVNFEFTNEVNLFIEQNNYFIPQYDFCK